MINDFTKELSELLTKYGIILVDREKERGIMIKSIDPSYSHVSVCICEPTTAAEPMGKRLLIVTH